MKIVGSDMSIKHTFRVSALVIALCGIMGCSEPTSAERLAKAEQFISEQDQNSAVIEIKNLLKQDKRNGKARFLLGQIYFNSGSWVASIKEFEQAIENKFEPDTVLPYLVKAYYQSRDAESLETLSNEIEGANADSQAAINTFFAMSLLQNGNAEEGKPLLETVTEEYKDSSYAKFANAVLNSINGDKEAALAILNDMLAEDPDKSEVIELKGHVLLSMAKFDEASEQFAKFLELHPQSLETRLIYANALVTAQNFEEAEKQADILLQVSQNHVLSNQIKAQALFSREDYEGAYDYADKATQAQYSPPSASILAGVSAFKLDRLENAYFHLHSVENRLPRAHPAYKLLAAIKLQLGYTEDALTSINAMSEADALDSDFAAASSLELFKKGQRAEAKALLTEASKSSPESASLAMQRGLFKVAENDESGIDDLKKAIELDPSMSNASAALALSYMSQKEFDKAHQVAEELRAADEISADALQGFIYRLEQKPEQAIEYLQKVVNQDPEHVGALYNLGLVAESLRKLADAQSYYQKVSTISPNHFDSVSALIRLTKVKELRPSIQKYLQDLQAQHPTSEPAALGAAESYRQQNNVTDALKVCNALLTSQPRSVKALMMKGQLLRQRKDFNASIDSFEQAIKLDRNNLMARLSKISVYQLKGDIPQALIETEKAIDAMPDTALFRVVSATLYLEQEDTKSAQAQLDKVPELYKDSDQVKRVKARIALANAEYDTAISLFQEIYEKRPDMRKLNDLILALQESSQYEVAIEEIEKVTAKNDKPVLVLEMKRAELYSYVDNQKALSIYQELEQLTNRNFAVMNNLAWSYMKNGQHVEAKEAVEIALTKSPNQPEILDTYGVILLALGENKEAVEALEKAYRSNRENTQFAVHLAEAMIATKNKDRARELVRNVNRDDIDSDTAERLKAVEDRLIF